MTAHGICVVFVNKPPFASRFISKFYVFIILIFYKKYESKQNLSYVLASKIHLRMYFTNRGSIEVIENISFNVIAGCLSLRTEWSYEEDDHT